MTEETKQQTNTMPEESRGGGLGAAAMDREELRRLYEESCAGIKEGAIIKGRVVKVEKDDVYVDIGYKSEGVVHISEFADLEEVKPGQEVDVLLESKEDPDGMVVVSRIKAEKQKRWDETIHRSEEGDVVRGKIIRKVRGGVIVDIGMDAFLPASQIDVRHVGNVDDYIGKAFDFKIIKINTERKNVVLSRRELLEEERARNREKLLSEIEVGQLREGVVKNITDFGAFIDLYGMDGLLHITDITWGRINHPSEVLSIGEKVEVMILDFDRERQRIALGLKQKAANPWQDIETKYPVGSIVKGTIVNIVPYGAFIEIERGVEGLIHISEMSWTRRINHPSEILNVGDEVEAMVLNIKKDEAKISLGIKQTEFNPWSVVEEKYPAGTRIRGRVRNITSYGAFVELEEGIDGLIHISDMSWTRKINHPTEVLKKGEITEALVLAVDQEAKKITLGLKQLEANPWETIDEFIRVGSVVEAEVTKIADFGVFATHENGIECLIHISQISEKPFQKIEDVVSKGDRVTTKVDRIDKQRRKIALSIKEYQRDLRLSEEKAAMEAAKAISFGEHSIVGMKEHIEQAVEQLAPETEATDRPDAGEPSESAQPPEEAPSGVGEPSAEQTPPDSSAPSVPATELESGESQTAERHLGEPEHAEIPESLPLEEGGRKEEPIPETPPFSDSEPAEALESAPPAEQAPAPEREPVEPQELHEPTSEHSPASEPEKPSATQPTEAPEGRHATEPGEAQVPGPEEEPETPESPGEAPITPEGETPPEPEPRAGEEETPRSAWGQPPVFQPASPEREEGVKEEPVNEQPEPSVTEETDARQTAPELGPAEPSQFPAVSEPPAAEEPVSEPEPPEPKAPEPASEAEPDLFAAPGEPTFKPAEEETVAEPSPAEEPSFPEEPPESETETEEKRERPEGDPAQ